MTKAELKTLIVFAVECGWQHIPKEELIGVRREEGLGVLSYSDLLPNDFINSVEAIYQMTFDKPYFGSWETLMEESNERK